MSEPDFRGVDVSLDPVLRDQLAAVWTRRAAAELGVAAHMRTTMRDLSEAGAEPNVLSLAWITASFAPS